MLYIKTLTHTAILLPIIRLMSTKSVHGTIRQIEGLKSSYVCTHQMSNIRDSTVFSSFPCRLATPAPSHTIRKSEELLHHQTAWLRELNRKFPEKAAPRVTSSTFPTPTLPSAPPSLPTYTVPHTQLVMDSNKDIHLVHL